MAENIKCRAMLLDEDTGAPIGEANIITRADCVTFTDGKTFQDKLDSGELRGQQGAPGEPGSIIYRVDGVPVDDLGVAGDWAIDPDTGDLYEKAEEWSLRGSLKGPQGETGPQGKKGEDGIALVGSAPEEAQRTRLFFQTVE